MSKVTTEGDTTPPAPSAPPAGDDENNKFENVETPEVEKEENTRKGGKGKKKVDFSPQFWKRQFFTLFGLVDFMRKVVRIHGWRFTWLLGLQYFGIKGVAASGTEKFIYPYFSGLLNVSADVSSRAGVIGTSPFAMKGLFGIISDCFPLFGYYKNPYILIGAVCSLVGYILLLAIPNDMARNAVAIPMIALFLIYVHAAVGDLMCQGKYAEHMRLDKQSIGESIVYTYSMWKVGIIFVAITAAPMTENVGVRMICVVAIPIIAICTIPSLIGWFPEERVAPEKRNKIDVKKAREFGGFLVIALLLGIASIVNVIISLAIPSMTYVRIGIVLLMTVILIVALFFTVPLMMAKCVVFMFIKDLVYPEITRILETWYMADNECVPGGPHFSLLYYQTYTSLLGIIMGLVGFAIFQRLSRYLSFRSVFVFTISLVVIGGFVDLIMVMRWNIDIGIPDKVMYVLGDAIVLDLVTGMNDIPGSIMIARLCPPTLESTTFAILAGFSNFGATIARFAGELSATLGGIETATPNCNFDSLPIIIVFSRLVIPLLIIPASLLLLPSIKLSESLLEHEAEQKRKLAEKKLLKAQRRTTEATNE